VDIRVRYVIGHAWCVPAALWSLSFVERAGGGGEYGFSDITRLYDTLAAQNEKEPF
jgi:hypothetical protein